MPKSEYPTVSEEFLLSKIRNSPKIDSSTEKKIGTSFSFLMVGDKPIYKRQVTIRSMDGEFNFIQATSKAILLGVMSELLEYFENEKGYKDGAYING